MAEFEVYDLKGKCDLKKPDRVFHLIEDYDLLDRSESKGKALNRIYFGIELSNTYYTKSKKAWYTKFNLSKRVYLGPTSTDAELAFMMVSFG